MALLAAARRASFALVLGLASCAAHAPPPAGAPAADVPVALVDGTVVTAPDAAPIADGVVVIEHGRVAAVGPRASTPVPEGAKRIGCKGGFVLAGFWNSHVHFTELAFEDAADKPSERLTEALDEMLLRWGFVHVVDAGSDPRNTLALRLRIEKGDVVGPAIVTLGPPFVAVGGQPQDAPVALPQLADARQARAAVNASLDGGADGVTLMTFLVFAHPAAPEMPLDVVRAASDVAHSRGALVMAHPTTIDGVRAAIDGGVDVLANTSPRSGPWSADDVARARRTDIALIPSLELWHWDAPDSDSTARQQVRAFAAAGGTLLFGTDVGYVTEHDPLLEYELLEKAGLDFRAILAMLTTAPARRWTNGKERGQIAVGQPGDVVVLDYDPRRDWAAWTRVRFALRGGRVVYDGNNPRLPFVP